MCIDELIDLLREYAADAEVRILVDGHERNIMTVEKFGDEVDIIAGIAKLS